MGAVEFLSRDEKRAAVGFGAEGGGAGSKGGWGSPDPGVELPSNSESRDVSTDDHWRKQPRVPPGSPDGGQWTSSKGARPSEGTQSDHEGNQRTKISDIVKICVPTDILREVDSFGNKSYTAIDECHDGFQLKRFGAGNALSLIHI